MLIRLLPQVLLGLILSIVYSSSVWAQLGIGTTTPHSSAALDVSSSEQGLLPPRMTNQERDSINGGVPAEGLVIYNTDEKCLQHWNGSEWKCTSADTSGGNTDVVTIKTVSGDKPHAFAFDDYKSFSIHPHNISISLKLLNLGWVSNDEFFVAGMIKSCIGDINACPYELRITHYNTNFGKTKEFEIPLGAGHKHLFAHISHYPSVSRLVNGDFVVLYPSSKCDDGVGHPRCYTTKIIDSQSGKVKKNVEEQDLAPWVPKSRVNGYSATWPSAIRPLDNGGFLVTLHLMEHGNNQSSYISLIFDKNGKIIKRNTELRILSGAFIHWATTKFGYIVIKKVHQTKSMDYSTYDFTGTLIKKISISSNHEIYSEFSESKADFLVRDKNNENISYLVFPKKIIELSLNKDSFSIISEKNFTEEGKVNIPNYRTSYVGGIDEIKKSEFVYIKDLKISNSGRKIPIGIFSDGSPLLQDLTKYDIYHYVNGSNKMIKSLAFAPGVRANNHTYNHNNNLGSDQKNFNDYQKADVNNYYYVGLDVSPDGKKLIATIPLEYSKSVISVFDSSDLNSLKQFNFIAKSNSVKQHTGKQFFLSSSEDSLQEVKIQIGSGYKNADKLESYCTPQAVACTSLGQYLVISGAKTGNTAPIQDFVQALNEMTFKTNAGAGKRIIEITATTANGVVGDTLKFTLNVSD